MRIYTWVLIGLLAVVVAFGVWWIMTGQDIGSSYIQMNTSDTTTTSETAGAAPVGVVASTQTVAALVASSTYGTTFNNLLSKTGVLSAISGKGPYTVFIPSDGAFGRVPPGSISSMTAAQIKRLVQYHIVSGKALQVSAVFSGQTTALSGDTLNFSVDPTSKAVYVNSGYVLHAYKASNGMVYVINSVLFPPTKTQ